MNNFITIPMLLILVGVVLTGIGGFCATYQANKEKLDFEQKINSKNEEIIQLSSKLAQFAIGGDNYPIITETIEQKSSKCHFIIGNMLGADPLPLYDVYALITDVEQNESIEQMDDLTLAQKIALTEKEAVFRINVGYLPGVAGSQHLFSVDLPQKNEEKTYKFELSSRNSKVTQYVTIYYDHEYERYHTKSKANKDGEYLFDSYEN